MKIFRATDYRTMPWKNGMGSTTEIAISPADATLDDFDWRISMAHVASDGPFSSFATIDRTLLVLEGNGIDLSVDARAPVRIDRDTIHSFPGDQPTAARLVAGPITDLNVMTRRDVLSHYVQRVRISGHEEYVIDTQTIIIVERGQLEVASPTSTILLDAHDAVIADPSVKILTLSTRVDTCIVAIRLRSRAACSDMVAPASPVDPNRD
ncbi:MAG: HutD family protein [Hyphomicrobiales bacterium]|nr:HutD family protein [Hyphomicrobiales bacterium]